MNTNSKIERGLSVGYFTVAMLLSLMLSGFTSGQEPQTDPVEEFGPVVRAYLGYLNDEQDVVDDRASRHEISAKYYRRNSNRIRALRKIALNIARGTNNDYLPELEAAASDELKTLFERPPNPRSFRVGDVLNSTYRYLGVVRAGEVFYVFARLNPYEQVEYMKSENVSSPADTSHSKPVTPGVMSIPANVEPAPDKTSAP